MVDHDIAVIHGELAGIGSTIHCLLAVLTTEQLELLSVALGRQAETAEANLLAVPVQDSGAQQALEALREFQQRCLQLLASRA